MNLFKKSENADRAVQVTVVGIIWNIILIIIKLFAGVYGRSSALVADAIHSMSDFVSDIAVLAGIRIARRPSDQTHNYGHGRFETLSTIVIAFSLIAAAAGKRFGWHLCLIRWRCERRRIRRLRRRVIRR